jgi:hypothetical protein
MIRSSDVCPCVCFGTQLTPRFGAFAFWPATRTFTQQLDALRFMMLQSLVTAAISTGAATLLMLASTQGLPKALQPAGKEYARRECCDAERRCADPNRRLLLAARAFELRLAGAGA